MKGTAMKMGHVTGNKKERKGSSDWYREIQEAHLARIEAEFSAKAQPSTQQPATTETQGGPPGETENGVTPYVALGDERASSFGLYEQPRRTICHRSGWTRVDADK